LISVNLLAQESRLEIMTKPIFVPAPIANRQLPNPEITELLQGKLSCSVIGVLIPKMEIHAPFKIYTFENRNWIINQDMLNAIVANVPSAQITNTNVNQTPNIRMRGTQNTIVMVDGVSYDASILNTLNPTEIESVRLSNNPAVELYFRFR